MLDTLHPTAPASRSTYPTTPIDSHPATVRRAAGLLEDTDRSVAGAACYAAEPFGDRVWNLYFLAARAGRRRAGAGSALIGHVEADLRSRGEHAARVLIVETSSLDGYEQARRFYRKHGFDEEARVREFYGPGDHRSCSGSRWSGLPRSAIRTTQRAEQ